MVLTSNRDESSLRPTDAPAPAMVNGQLLTFPRDLEKGGTWIATSADGRACCLLNGAMKPHERAAFYKRSRGQLVLEACASQDLSGFFQACEGDLLDGVEPFTLVVVEPKGGTFQLFELRWDAVNATIRQLDADRPYLWASATLYEEASTEAKRSAFLAANHTEDAIFQLHEGAFAVGGRLGKLRDERIPVVTVSVTQVVSGPQGLSMHYEPQSFCLGGK
jgi:hypothetical protein